MANTKSAEKQARQATARRERNRANRSRMRGAVKRLRQAVETGDAEQAAALLPETIKVVDQTARKKAVHPNVAARTKSRLTRAVRGLAK